MQSKPTFAQPGELVRVRRQRWRVLQACDAGGLRLVTLSGASMSNATVVQSFISPFDTLEPIAASSPLRAPARLWRRAARQLIATTAPPGSLHVLPHTNLTLMPHQLEPALSIVAGGNTCVLLADEVGLGKTIEAGLILAELRDRAAARRTLVLTPAALREQWRTELRDRFDIDATAVDSAGLATRSATFVAASNPWLTYEVVIASIDLVKRSEHLAAVLECAWDLLIVDEAHHAAGDSERRTAIERIAERTPYVVLATATPHNGDPAAFQALCEIGGHGSRCTVFRRTRDDLDVGEKRRARHLSIVPTDAEQRMHSALAELTRAVAEEGVLAAPHSRLVVTVLNKRALSSARALQWSVSRRLEALADASGGALQSRLPFDDLDGELDQRDDAPQWDARPALTDIERERRLLTRIGQAAEAAVARGESKLRVLARWLRRTREPVIVFSEYRDTLRHVAKWLELDSVLLHGGLTAAERRLALDAFECRVPVLLATDAAGEGLNLHRRCRLVVNLELPWNPVRLEQRIGRVDRIGQRRVVHALTLVASGTPEERILGRLCERISQAHREIGAADPLGVVDEREIESVALGFESTGMPEQPVQAAFRPDVAFETAAHVEADRCALVRRAAAAERRGLVPGRPLVGVLRHRRTRERLRRPTLVLVELLVEDGRGAIVDRTLLSLAADAIASDWLVCPRLFEEALADSDVVRHACIETPARAFAAARLERETKILAALTSTLKEPPLQQGLFDRRAERHAAVLRASAAAATEAAEGRMVLAARAAARCDIDTRVRLILRTAR